MDASYTSLSDNVTAKGKVEIPAAADVPVHAFLGIPYARPPVGELRFRPPEPQELWTGERDCTEFAAACPQQWAFSKATQEWIRLPLVKKMSEDCLYLDVYTPNPQAEERLPVMVWIHGGAFCVGSGSSYDGSILAGLHNVVVVTINYRLGMFGFFTTGDDVIPGNYGLLDQVEALKWVQKHITSFGGDPDNVTIFGESAGGMSCSLHILSDLASGLFHRAIVQSGASTSPYAVTTQEQARKLLQPKLDALGYKGNSSEELADFMRGRTVEELGDLGDDMFTYKPVIDAYYLKDYPYNLYRFGQFDKVPIIEGYTSHEGTSLPNMILPSEDYSTLEEDLRKYVRQFVNLLYHDNQEAISDALFEQYITPDALGNKDLFLRQFVDLTGHAFHAGPSSYFTLKHSAKAPVYLYCYAYRLSKSVHATWIGADHAEDVYVTFGCPLTDPTSSAVDKHVSKHVMAYWTNFAKSGDPNGPQLTNWSSFVENGKAYMILKDEPEEGVGYFELDRTKFWLEKMPTLNKLF